MTSQQVQYCYYCGRISPIDATRCINCQRNRLRQLDFVPKWLLDFDNERKNGGKICQK